VGKKSRERGRQERERLLREAAKRTRQRRIRIAVVVGLVVAAIAAVAITGGSERPVEPSLPGLQTGPAPWGPNPTQLRARLRAIGLPALSAEGTVVHTHSLLQIYVFGDPEPVPANIGVGRAFISPIHTHDDTGIVHVESPTLGTFTLGKVFDVWGVRFTETCIGIYCTGEGNRLRVFVDGEPYQGDPRGLELAQHQDIVMAYGTEAQLPDPIPSRYSKSISPSCSPPPTC
jgi:hypothetical protein